MNQVQTGPVVCAILSVSILLFCETAVAETSDFSEVQSLISDKKLDEAERQIDLVLKKESNNVDALMYKGNILYYKGSNYGGIALVGNENESIYDQSMGFIGESSSLTTAATAKQVAVYFKRALQYAPHRMDIQMGLCYVYANAGMKQELMTRLPVLKKYGQAKEGLQYNMGDYARIIANNYSFDDGIKVYREIVRLYPDDDNIVSDIAAMHFMHGDLDNAIKYFAQVNKKGGQDRMTLGNLVLIYAIVGDYEKSLQYQKALSELTKDNVYLLYRALKRRLANVPGWAEDAQSFIEKSAGNKENGEYTDFANSILPVQGKYSYEKFDTSQSHKVSTYISLINYEWAVKEYPNRFETVFGLAELLTYYKNYVKALPLYEHIEKSTLHSTKTERYKHHFHYAWALYKTGNISESNKRWQALLDSEDLYMQSAASYFLGNYHYKRKEFKQAAEYFEKGKGYPAKSKYSNYCHNLYDRIEKKDL